MKVSRVGEPMNIQSLFLIKQKINFDTVIFINTAFESIFNS